MNISGTQFGPSSKPSSGGARVLSSPDFLPSRTVVPEQAATVAVEASFRVRDFGKWLFLFLICFSAFAQEITVLNFSGDNVNAGALTFPVGETHFTWPYSQTNWVFNYRRVTYAFPVDQDFHLHIDRQRVVQTIVMSSTEWFFMGFGLAMTIAGYFWVVRIVNQLFQANPEVP